MSNLPPSGIRGLDAHPGPSGKSLAALPESACPEHRNTGRTWAISPPPGPGAPHATGPGGGAAAGGGWGQGGGGGWGGIERGGGWGGPTGALGDQLGAPQELQEAVVRGDGVKYLQMETGKGNKFWNINN